MANNEKKKITIRRSIRRRGTSLFPLFFICAGVFCVIAGIKSYSYAYDYTVDNILPKPEVTEGEEQYSPNEIIRQAKQNMIGADIDGVIKNIDGNTVTFVNLKANESVILKATKDTNYPGTNSLDDYFIGDVVTFVYDEDNNLTDIKKCENAWSFSDVGLIVNTSAKLVKFGSNALAYKDKAFKYSSDITTVRYKNEYSTLASIDTSDYVTLKGYNNGTENKVYSITIDKSHGDLQFVNYSNLDSPQFVLNGQTISLAGSDTFKVTEGKHTIQVTSPMCEDYTKDVLILPGQVTKVDLSAMQIKTGLLNVSANVINYKLFINDKEYSLSEPILLSYGRYNVKVTKDGYEDFTATAIIDSETNTLHVDMEKHIPKGRIHVDSDPDGASVYIDGSMVGKTPLNYSTTLGTHTITAKKNEYIESTKTVSLAAEGDETGAYFDLMPVVSPFVDSE
ncbi:MAG: PEGA domain-containing protein [Firmicutes bacterium]|nr:PEGA domain-containing protein [Bacillota bacterium]